MHDLLTGLVVAVAAATSLVLLVLIVRDRLPEDRTFTALIGLEVLVLVEVVVGIVSLARTDRPVSGVLFVSYLLATLLSLPIGAVWSLAERNRSGTGVILAAVLVVLFLQLRLEQIWTGVDA